MRFGWLMTAAAAVCAVPAEAQTYLRYQITGIGQYQPVDGTVVPVGPSSADYFSTSFDVLQSGVVGGSLSLVSDGNVFQALVGGVSSSFVDTANASQSGLLTFNYKSGGETGGVSYQSTVNYADTDTVGGFPTISSIATGNFTATSLNYTQQKYYTFNGVVSGPERIYRSHLPKRGHFCFWGSSRAGCLDHDDPWLRRHWVCDAAATPATGRRLTHYDVGRCAELPAMTSIRAL